jgi:hypothetical protein
VVRIDLHIEMSCHKRATEVAAGPAVAHMMNGSNLILGSGAVIEDPARFASRMMTEEWPYYDGLL